VLESEKGDEQIYSKVEKLVEMAKAEKVKARVEGFTAGGGGPRARLVIEADGEAAGFSIRLNKDNTVVLEFSTTSREEAERRAAVLKAAGVKVEVGKRYNKFLQPRRVAHRRLDKRTSR
jgi:hypothetical protein